MAQRKHGFSAQVTERDYTMRATQWLGKCGRHAEWVGASYEEIEDEWRRHVYEETGRAPSPQGDKENRWSPEVAPR